MGIADKAKNAAEDLKGKAIGVTDMASPDRNFFSILLKKHGVDPVRDQGIAGILAWTYGELPLVIILIVTLSRWHSQDTTRAAKAQSRSDAETDAYNEYLQRLQQRDVDTTADP